MVSLIDHFEYIVTDSEAEALILECNLIKKNMPKFNVLLKDDKTYPYIKVDLKQDYPSVIYTRQMKNDGAKYFGPYADASAAKEMVNFIKEKFKIRQCKIFKSNKRACLNFHINKCLAPCIGNIRKEEYREQINQVIMLLEGKTERIIKKLNEDLQIASEKQEYEEAAYLRDKIVAIRTVSEKQKVSNISENDIDVIGIARNELAICIEIFFVRHSKMVGREHYFFNNLEGESDKDILSEFIKQYYIDKEIFPNKIMFREEIEDKDILQEVFTNKALRKVELKTPFKGEKLKFIELAEKNAKITLDNKSNDKFNILNEIKETLALLELPRKIESFDVSNISGQYIVAGMVVAQDGIVKRNLSRRFKIKSVLTQDDPACTEEVVTRRLKHSIENPKGGFGKLPDLIFADGGITQIRAIKKALNKYNLNIPVYGMVKDEKHNTKVLINEQREEIKMPETFMNFITNLQNEVHDVAINYHRKLREQSMKKSILDDIEGIGKKKKQELLKAFGNIDNIKKANIEELTKIKGINEEVAKKIKEYVK